MAHLKRHVDILLSSKEIPFEIAGCVGDHASGAAPVRAARFTGGFAMFVPSQVSARPVVSILVLFFIRGTQYNSITVGCSCTSLHLVAPPPRPLVGGSLAEGVVGAAADCQPRVEPAAEPSWP